MCTVDKPTASLSATIKRYCLDGNLVKCVIVLVVVAMCYVIHVYSYTWTLDKPTASLSTVLFIYLYLFILFFSVVAWVAIMLNIVRSYSRPMICMRDVYICFGPFFLYNLITALIMLPQRFMRFYKGMLTCLFNKVMQYALNMYPLIQILFLKNKCAQSHR